MKPLIHGRGTPESVWEAWRLAALPDLHLGERHVVVVAPHPDDEVLGLGGTLALLARAGTSIEVVALTDGERGSASGRPSRRLASCRRAETGAALTRLLGTCPPIHYAELPDGAVGAALDRAAAAVRARLEPGSICFSPHPADGHPDHEAAAAATAIASGSVGCRVVHYPIWLWHWAGPGDIEAIRPRLRKVALPPSVLTAKQHAIELFVSQLPGRRSGGILPAHVVARFQRPFEVFAT